MTTQEISKAIQDFANDIDTYTSVHERQNTVFAESGGKADPVWNNDNPQLLIDVNCTFQG